MARICSIYPGMASDEAYMSMSMAAKAAWPVLWTECDDHGLFEWKPIVLKARIFPADNVDFAAILAEYQRLDCVEMREVNGKPFGFVRNFCRFQRPKHPSYGYELPEEMQLLIGLLVSPPPVVGEASPPPTEKCPQMKEEEEVEEERKKALVQIEHLNEGELSNGEAESEFPQKRNSRKKTRKENNLDPFFLEFYAAYPRHQSKGDALKAYAQSRRAGISHEAIMRGLEQAKRADRRFREARFTPLPASWLRAGGYEDELNVQNQDWKMAVFS